LTIGEGYINRSGGSLLINNRSLSPSTPTLFLQSTIASNDDGDDSFDKLSELTGVEEASSKDELMIQPNSSDDKLMCKRARSSYDGGISST
jgi:hypothetical protein